MTFNFSLAAGILLSDWIRADLDWKNGIFSWRYRNKLSLGRTFAIRSYHFIPYVAAEILITRASMAHGVPLLFMWVLSSPWENMLHRRRSLPANSQMVTKHRRRKFMSQMYQFAQS